MNIDWRPLFEMTSTVRGKCRECGMEMDVRAGRPQRHLLRHTDLQPPQDIPEPIAPPGAQEKSKPEKEPSAARGSRDWAIQKALDQIDHPQATPDTVIKGLALLKDYQQFGSSRLDDEKEAASHAEQWDRVLKRDKELREAEDRLLRVPAVRKRLAARIKELEEARP